MVKAWADAQALKAKIDHCGLGQNEHHEHEAEGPSVSIIKPVLDPETRMEL